VNATARSGVAEALEAMVAVRSQFLGTIYYDLDGRYSPTGFYDSAARKWRLWAGGGIPEAPACDNVWYSEFDSATLPLSDLTEEALPPVRCQHHPS